MVLTEDRKVPSTGGPYTEGLVGPEESQALAWPPRLSAGRGSPRPEQPLGRGSALSRLGAELELRRSGSFKLTKIGGE